MCGHTSYKSAQCFSKFVKQIFARMHTLVLVAVIIASVILCSDALSCPRRPDGTLYCTDVDPKTCRYGTVSDICSFCQVCAKGPGEECGGIWNIGGRCGKGYFCHGNPQNWQRPGQCKDFPPKTDSKNKQ
ncbi:hypothetical protein CHUAL_009960 [Chamberlinius hualienensis]